MHSEFVFPISTGLRLERISSEADKVCLLVSSESPRSECPKCGHPGSHVHSRYVRTLQDLPCHGKRVEIRWRCRKYFCDSPGCPQRIFTERLPEVTWPYGRRTVRLKAMLRSLGIAMGGEPGSRLARHLAMPVSGDTLLRTIRGAIFPIPPPAQVVSVDEWAMCRGQRYGTVLVDLERHRVLGLLPDRKMETFRDWLVQHPEVQVICRDRASWYAQGAAAGAPAAVQVADRWHLLKNLRDALKRAAERFPREIHEAATEVTPAKSVMESPPTAMEMAVAEVTQSHDATVAEPISQQETRRLRRYEKYRRVHELHAEGKSQRCVARILHLDRGTVARFLHAAVFPERAARSVPRKSRPYLGYLQQRWSEGCHNASTLTREINALGYRGSYDAVKRRVPERRFYKAWLDRNTE